MKEKTLLGMLGLILIVAVAISCGARDEQFSSSTGIDELVGLSPQCDPDIFDSSRLVGDIKPGEELKVLLVKACDAARYPLILPASQKVRITLSGSPEIPALYVYGPGIRGLFTDVISTESGKPATLEFTPDIAGEYYVIAATSDRTGPAYFHLKAECLENCNLKATRYPIVMVHGFSGFSSIGPIDYFYKVKDTFAPMGYDLHIAVLAPYNSTVDVRGPELAAFVDEVLEETYANKINIIAHSQGGVDSRFIISSPNYKYGDRVGMLNMIATPNYGTPIADIALENWGVEWLMEILFKIFGIVIEDPKQLHDLKASLNQLSVKTMVGDFNPNYPDDPQVRYKSWAGYSCFTLVKGCHNPVNPLLIPSWSLIYSWKGGTIDNDGIVPTDSAKWTGFQKVIDADHFAEVGQLLGMTGNFKYLDFYQNIIEAMVAEGY